MNHFALHDAAIFTVDPGNRVIPRGTLIVEDGRISAVGPSDELIIPPGMPVIDASGHALLPGLIDAHSHSSLMRGVTENMQLMEWLPYYQLEHRALTEDYAFHSARLCYLDALKSGTTCVMDMYRFMHRCADAAGEIGLRVNLAPYVADEPGKDFFATRAENRALIHSHHGSQNGRIQVWMGLEHLFYCTPDAYREALECQAEYGVGIHTHACEQKEEDDAVKAHFGRRSIAQLDHYGILGERTLIAHCVWLNDDEIKRIADTGTAISHCPISNAKLASGVARVPEMLAAGITVGLGTDGPVCNNSLSLFEEMKFASLIQKATRLDATVLPADQILRMATINGARALGLGDRIGSLEVGKQADLLLLDLAQPNLTPTEINAAGGNLLWNLVFAADARNVAAVWVDGRQLIANGRATRVNEQQVLSEAQQHGLALFQQCRDISHLRTSMV
ncbi:amidohydrolase [Halopseudomonas aestusnigri]|jgi:5-methylthioadenosine/S-adenosylhomocysteine deaminase|uniref:amidohydrolase family protein n=1 Tax=Halopseudomonas aestusnigri TaxID=857252 RepID=UPI000C8CDB37|nr:5-methylthioadenosine deaminase [Pseudomonadales bacterium]HBT55627.1 5-methylthioadenosine deaminase [Pseudomonas sp.]HCP01907.1 5-methylthioadenosine deaminase [Pseudomonas sp.]|tara:strand:+ start:2228 stop:3574 length:1347 start_codon:yes stop_codon:yes gene_type:complete